MSGATAGVPPRLKLLDVVTYAVALTAVFFALGAAVGLLRGNGLTSAKYVLFWAGFLTLGLGSWKLRPKAAWKQTSRFDLANSKRESPFQRLLLRLPPLSRYDLRREELPSDGLKFLAGSVAMLATSFALETVVGV